MSGRVARRRPPQVVPEVALGTRERSSKPRRPGLTTRCGWRGRTEVSNFSVSLNRVGSTRHLWEPLIGQGFDKAARIGCGAECCISLPGVILVLIAIVANTPYYHDVSIHYPARIHDAAALHFYRAHTKAIANIISPLWILEKDVRATDRAVVHSRDALAPMRVARMCDDRVAV